MTEVTLPVSFRGVDFVVVDVETTGLYPNGHDRVVEIGIVRTTSSGEVLDEYSTLINPNRDVGPTSIHGISASDVASAPPFDVVAGDVVDRLAEAILVGHNVEFDIRFLVAEFSRLGARLSDLSRLCTLELSTYLRPPPLNSRLGSCCAACAIAYENPHLASADAKATSLLFHHIVGTLGWKLVGALVYNGDLLPRGGFQELSRKGEVLTRAGASLAREKADTYLGRLIENLPLSKMVSGWATADSPRVLQYLNVIDRALEDRYVSSDEAETLMALANEWGLERGVVLEAHQLYLDALAKAAVADGVVTRAEYADLALVTTLLGLQQEALNAALEEARSQKDPQEEDVSRESLGGKTVCFTGEMRCEFQGQPISREMAESFAEHAGLVIKSNVSRKLDLLVTADPHTLSTKAQKAREYGTRVIAESVFWQMIGLAVD